jgi:hypothetical protein
MTFIFDITEFEDLNLSSEGLIFASTLIGTVYLGIFIIQYLV